MRGVLLVAASYAAFALAFVWLATPPGVAAPFWPASGVAVAVVWVYGRRAVAPICLGAFVANLLVLGFSAEGLIGASGISLAAGTEALLAWWALRGKESAPMQHARHLVGVGLLAPLIPAFIGPMAIFVAFDLGLDRLPFEFVSWWAGDAMGILIAGPIILRVISRTPRGRVTRRVVVVPILLLGIVLSLNFAAVRNVADRELEAASTERGQAAGRTVELGLARVAELTFNLSSYFDASELVTADEFALFTAPPLERIGGVESLVWFELQESSVGESVVVSHAQPSDVDFPDGNLLLSPAFAQLLGTREDSRVRVAPIGGDNDLLLAVAWTPRGSTPGWAAARIRVSEFLPEVFDGRIPEGLTLRVADGSEAESPLHHQIGFGDQILEVRFESSPPGASARRDRDLLVNYVVGVLFAAATVLFLLLIAAHNEELAAETASRRAAEERLKRTAEELARSNQDLEEFASGASHDLRAPLRAITGLSGLVLEDERERLSEESIKMLELVRSRADRLEMMIRGLLDYARVGQGGEPELIQLDDLIAEAVEIAVVPRKFQVEVSVPKRFRARRAALLTVLTNLIANAARHHDRESGTIRVVARRQPLTLQWRVEDDGPGIPDADRSRVFKVFTTLKSRDQNESTGMGLATVRRIVQREGGEVECQPGDPRGVVIQFSWPDEPEEQG
ncbi:MAG: signal transduction histidine kinase [Bradymonadia bacterium]|jgi:signal transduction histidine kinase